MTNGTAALIEAAKLTTEQEPVTPVVLAPTPEQRQQAFVDAYNALVAKHGVTLVPQMKPRILGEVVQVEAALVVALVSDWKAE